MSTFNNCHMCRCISITTKLNRVYLVIMAIPISESGNICQYISCNEKSCNYALFCLPLKIRICNSVLIFLFLEQLLSMICSYYVTNSVKRVKVKELFHWSLCLLVKLDVGTWIFHCHTFFFCACLKIQFKDTKYLDMLFSINTNVSV